MLTVKNIPELKDIRYWVEVDYGIYRFYFNAYDYFEILHMDNDYRLFIVNVFGRENVTCQQNLEDCLVSAYYTYQSFFDLIHETVELIDYDNSGYTVYKHVSPDDKVYIGCTKQSPITRWQPNGTGYRKNREFYSDITKFGWDSFDHIIIAEHLSEDDGYGLERRLIIYYKSKSDCYNKTLGGKGSLGYCVSQETREKLSRVHLGKKKRPETIKKILGPNHYLYGKHLSEETKKKLSMCNMGKTMKPESILKRILSDPNRKPVKCVETDVIYNSSSEASRATTVLAKSISKACAGKIKTTGGYHWTYVNPDTMDVDIEGLYDELRTRYSSIISANIATIFKYALSDGVITEIEYEKAKVYYGSLWNYLDDKSSNEETQT